MIELRENIERKNGMMTYRLNGIHEFAEDVAKKLCDEYPTIDLYDLMYQFEMQFRHCYTKEMLNRTR